jgi:hypothetical protein
MNLSLMNVLGFSSSVHLAHVICYWKFFLFALKHKSSVSRGFAEQIMHILRIFYYNGSLVIWTVVSLTTATSWLALYSHRNDRRTEHTASSIIAWRFCWGYHVIDIQPVHWCADCCVTTSCNIRPLRTQLPSLRAGTCLRSRCLAMIMYCCHALKRGVYRAVV